MQHVGFKKATKDGMELKYNDKRCSLNKDHGKIDVTKDLGNVLLPLVSGFKNRAEQQTFQEETEGLDFFAGMETKSLVGSFVVCKICNALKAYFSGFLSATMENGFEIKNCVLLRQSFMSLRQYKHCNSFYSSNFK